MKLTTMTIANTNQELFDLNKCVRHIKQLVYVKLNIKSARIFNICQNKSVHKVHLSIHFIEATSSKPTQHVASVC